MLQLGNDVHTCNHAMCAHFQHQFWNTFATNFFTMIPIDTTIELLMFNYVVTIMQQL
jgi:hypothetical protein